MIEMLQHCPRPMALLFSLVAAAVGMGLLVGASVALGLCAVAYMVRA